MSTPVLEVVGLTVEAATAAGPVRILEDLHLRVEEGEVVGLVGESGSGKSMTALAVLQVLGPTLRILDGSIRLAGRELIGLPVRELRQVRGRELGMVFQDPSAALVPSSRVGEQIAEVVRVHQGLSRAAAWDRAVTLLDQVGIPSPKERARSYPHHFSGGMRQRVAIAVALACNPRLLIADEPTTALDVTIQAQILDLLQELQADSGVSVLFVSHDLGVIADVCDRVTVMYAGQVVESALVEEFFAAPRHPYAAALLSAVPRPGATMRSIPGAVPDFASLDRGCRFAPRCAHRAEVCGMPVPLRQITASREARCARLEEIHSPSGAAR